MFNIDQTPFPYVLVIVNTLWNKKERGAVQELQIIGKLRDVRNLNELGTETSRKLCPW